MPRIRYMQEHSISKSMLRNVILDFDAYASFIPQVRHCTVHDAGNSAWEVEIEMFVIRPLFYRIRMEEEKDEGVLRWDLLEGVFTTNRGFWKLTETETGCLVHYEVEIQLGTFLPSLIAKTVQEKSIPDLIAAFVQEAHDRADILKKTGPSEN